MELQAVLEILATDGQLVHLERLPPRSATTASLATPLPDLVAERVPAGGLWAHQARAIDLLRAGRSVALATGTASGKSLAFQLPIAEAVLAQPRGTALLLYPTKALAQDQLRALAAMEVPGLVAVTYDGDATPEQRTWARRHANVVLTNPDMLHVGILPSHARWADFLHRLRYVVLDELHTLRGVFGTHVAHVVRRLRRLCETYGSNPTFICCSATIGEPAELAGAVTGLPMVGVTDDASPRGERLFALWNPPVIDRWDGRRASAHGETARLLATLVQSDHRAIAFTRSRRGAEVVAAQARGAVPANLAASIRSYRGGYLPSERREIEAELFDGRLRGVAATNALELGVDIGGLDACILDGFPGTIASMWQQAGRAGRACQHSLAVLVAGEDALDQWLMSHPRAVFTRPPEASVVNPRNPFILHPHVACAAYERPLVPDDAALWEEDALDEAVLAGVRDDVLTVRDGRAVFAGRTMPATGVGLRSGSSGEYRIVDSEARLIGTVDEARAFDNIHPGAIYLHQGQHYLVEKLDIEDRAAWVVPADGSHWTQTRSHTDIRILGEDERVQVGAASLVIGSVEVTQQVVGYQRRASGSGELLGTEELALPATRLYTRSFWYVVPRPVLHDARLSDKRVPGALHAAEHAGIGILPLFTICDRWDVGGVSTAAHSQTGEAMIFIYDGYPGGAGIAELGFAAGARHVSATLDVIAGCPCDRGCPSCVQSPKCGNLNEPLDKSGAIDLLRTVLVGRASAGREATGPRGVAS